MSNGDNIGIMGNKYVECKFNVNKIDTVMKKYR